MTPSIFPDQASSLLLTSCREQATGSCETTTLKAKSLSDSSNCSQPAACNHKEADGFLNNRAKPTMFAWLLLWLKRQEEQFPPYSGMWLKMVHLLIKARAFLHTRSPSCIWFTLVSPLPFFHTLCHHKLLQGGSNSTERMEASSMMEVPQPLSAMHASVWQPLR